jgi:nitronate monooxygenase
MNWNNRVTELLKTEYPIIQAPMLVVTTPEMVAAVSNLGCLGSLPLGYSNQEKAIEKIRAVKQLTDRPFAVNFFAYEQPDVGISPEPSTLREFYNRYAVPFFDELPQADPFPYYTELIDIVLAENIPVVSFHFGIPEPEDVKRLKSENIVLIGSATCTEEARMIEAAGLDMVVAQGVEAGGNRGTFINGNLPEVGLISLVPQIMDAVSIPVIAAGGLMSPQSIAAAFMLGASGVQLGSFFLRCMESGAPSSWKEAVASSMDTSTVLTRAWSGRYGRCITNEFVEQINEEEIFPSPFQHYLTNKLREEGRKKNDPAIQSLWAGQSAKYAEDKSVKDLLTKLIAGTEELLSYPFHF